MKATEQYFLVVLFIILCKVDPTFESVDEILKCDHSNESYWAVLSCGAVYHAVQGGSQIWVCGWKPKVWPFKWKLLSSTFLWCCLSCCAKVVPCFESVDEILKYELFKWKLLSSTFLWCCLSCCAKWFPWVCGWSILVTIQMKATEQYFPCCCLLCCRRFFPMWDLGLFTDWKLQMLVVF